MNSVNLPLSRGPILRFLPAILMMLAIFLFSAGSAYHNPQRLLEIVINKGGHMIGYAILALTYWRVFEFRGKRFWLAWLLTVLYALTDEYHQSFVAGRHPSLFDALFYDNLGALIGLSLAALFFKSKQEGHTKPVVDDQNRISRE